MQLHKDVNTGVLQTKKPEKSKEKWTNLKELLGFSD